MRFEFFKRTMISTGRNSELNPELYDVGHLSFGIDEYTLVELSDCWNLIMKFVLTCFLVLLSAI